MQSAVAGDSNEEHHGLKQRVRKLLKGRGKKKDQFFQSSQLLIHGNLLLRTAERDALNQHVSQLLWPLTLLAHSLGFPGYCWVCIYTSLPRYCSGGCGINTARQLSVTPATGRPQDGTNMS